MLTPKLHCVKAEGSPFSCFSHAPVLSTVTVRYTTDNNYESSDLFVIIYEESVLRTDGGVC